MANALPTLAQIVPGTPASELGDKCKTDKKTIKEQLFPDTNYDALHTGKKKKKKY